MKGRQKVE